MTLRAGVGEFFQFLQCLTRARVVLNYGSYGTIPHAGGASLSRLGEGIKRPDGDRELMAVT